MGDGQLANRLPIVALDPFDESTWDDIEKLYFERVCRFFEEERGIPFTNGNAAHAVYLIVQFFKRAVGEVRIFSGSLARQANNGVQIYAHPKLLVATGEFLRRGGELRIVVEKEIDGGEQSHPLIGEFRHKSGFRLVHASGDSISFLKSQKYLHHMMVMDETAWRLETKTHLDRKGSLTSVEAIVNVFDKSRAEVFKDLFDTVLFDEGKPLTSNMTPAKRHGARGSCDGLS